LSDIVFRPWSPESAFPLKLLRAGFRCAGDDLALEDNSIKLLTHPPSLRLTFDLVSVDNSFAIRVRATCVSVSDCAGRMLCSLTDYFKSADTTVLYVRM